MARADLSRRLDKLAAIIRPADSLAAKVDALEPQERAIFDQWQTTRAAWHKQFTEPADAYEALLNGNVPPRLHWKIDKSLYGPDVDIRKSATMDKVRNEYNFQMEK